MAKQKVKVSGTVDHIDENINLSRQGRGRIKPRKGR